MRLDIPQEQKPVAIFAKEMTKNLQESGVKLGDIMPAQLEDEIKIAIERMVRNGWRCPEDAYYVAFWTVILWAQIGGDDLAESGKQVPPITITEIDVSRMGDEFRRMMNPATGKERITDIPIGTLTPDMASMRSTR